MIAKGLLRLPGEDTWRSGLIQDIPSLTLFLSLLCEEFTSASKGQSEEGFAQSGKYIQEIIGILDSQSTEGRQSNQGPLRKSSVVMRKGERCDVMFWPTAKGTRGHSEEGNQPEAKEKGEGSLPLLQFVSQRRLCFCVAHSQGRVDLGPRFALPPRHAWPMSLYAKNALNTYLDDAIK